MKKNWIKNAQFNIEDCYKIHGKLEQPFVKLSIEKSNFNYYTTIQQTNDYIIIDLRLMVNDGESNYKYNKLKITYEYAEFNKEYRVLDFGLRENTSKMPTNRLMNSHTVYKRYEIDEEVFPNRTNNDVETVRSYTPEGTWIYARTPKPVNQELEVVLKMYPKYDYPREERLVFPHHATVSRQKQILKSEIATIAEVNPKYDGNDIKAANKYIYEAREVNLNERYAKMDIINYRRGRQVVDVTVVCGRTYCYEDEGRYIDPEEIEISAQHDHTRYYYLGDVVEIYKCRAEEYVELARQGGDGNEGSSDATSIAVDNRGKAKRYMVIQSDCVYDGEFAQKLKLKEVYRDGFERSSNEY